MDLFAQHYPEHIQILNQRVAEIVSIEGLSGLVIHSGRPQRQFLDDMDYPFKVNPQFKAWLPIIDNPHCWLLVNGTDKPTLLFYRPVDFWHKVADAPDAFWCEHFNIHILTKVEDVGELLPKGLKSWAYIGEHVDLALELGMASFNPSTVMNYLHFHRTVKTEYELECLREANRIAVTGHQAAKNAFYHGACEFDIQQAYLSAVGQTENEMPYGNIVALNENAAILHYTGLARKNPEHRHSFLIDAGAQCHGYASDITRTYSFEKNQFDDLVMQMDNVQLSIIDMMAPSVNYVDLHIACHEKIAQLLLNAKLAVGDKQGLIEQGITRAFFPHGLGHMLGLQVHDMGGFLGDDKGTHIASPAAHPFLRCTRTLTANQVLTIEPGLYIIDSLLSELKQDKRQYQVNWDVVEQLRYFGGIRIEDNVIVHHGHNENMTREAGLN
ncbi:Xaa-Pro dipeptidase [uncultured Shewanella sp.]|uniref:Xaa-Pro dipeptidase n=1 Tax=uncultured Shewanella sp. TaxID=173975 RepID=UPI002616A76A|nr:Xaa-Pro dipeptidase [uncultured Shewanella sp.]